MNLFSLAIYVTARPVVHYSRWNLYQNAMTKSRACYRPSHAKNAASNLNLLNIIRRTPSEINPWTPFGNDFQTYSNDFLRCFQKLSVFIGEAGVWND